MERQAATPDRSADRLYNNIYMGQLRHARLHGFRVYAGPAAVRRTIRGYEMIPPTTKDIGAETSSDTDDDDESKQSAEQNDDKKELETANS